MTAIPARVAGVGEIVAVCPRPDPIVLAAAAAAGVTRLFRVGGAHAVAAIAYGTATIPRVDKIVGPGNKYVAAAKAYVSKDCAIDFQAGPSEILILSDTGDPAWLAADLIAQAEHDPDARAVLITSRRRLARAVARELELQMPKDGPAPRALRDNGGVVVTRTEAEAVALANRMAPEHLVVDDEWTARAVRSAGAVFIGAHTAQVAGDYAIGSNHVLPTGGAARFRGGLSAADFVRVVSVQRLTPRGLRDIAPAVVTLATAEGLLSHARVDPREGVMTGEYERPLAAPGGLRLHLNENTAGCSPRVLAALGALTGEDIAFYPDYGDVERETAAFLGVPRSHLILTNGLDEGIFVAVVAAARATVSGESAIRPEIVVPLPAFDMYGVTARAVGARLVEVKPQAGFGLPVEAVRAAITPRTRIVFITSPNNPTGVRVGLDAIEQVAAALPPGAAVFVDEAYHDFCGDTALPLLASALERDRRTHVRKGSRAGRPEGRVPRGRTRTPSRGFGPSCRPTA